MSEHHSHGPAPANLAWIGVIGGGAALTWAGAIALVICTHTGDVDPYNAIGACILAATLSVVLAILGVRWVLQAFAAADHARIVDLIEEHRGQCVEEHLRIVATVQQSEARIGARIAAVLNDARWQGYAAHVQDDPNVLPLRRSQ